MSDMGYVDSSRNYVNKHFDLVYKIPDHYYFVDNTGVSVPLYRPRPKGNRSLKELNSRELMLAILYSPDTTARIVNPNTFDGPQFSLYVARNNSEDDKKSTFVRAFNTAEDVDFRFWAKERDLAKYQLLNYDFFGYSFTCIEAIDAATGRHMLLGQSDYFELTLYVRVIFKTPEEYKQLQDALATFHL